ncbi:sulfate ABC transporter permease subunit CysW [Testudinibacter sp. TR-2022]|uniref:sulfate ABC transporter permease subunit CysW n=1 Tax=Testudinibacter sp. TR-2022 TaxID=2585029 RepID=UPI00111BCE20|nr:sulfate ABC transporter permease subunit CysW [Testudinibacter sp. TR-2022]TNH05011.1 sulfate ABC transporter permease subunit CysW [Pasteurellaceae bacterium Phil11]TNH21329.1 sulfate ABC transporter permease subunit CysW [Testudinibacter sp. TR-2022]TNH26481.1 sulfate ABC transporter permease subunit CysW [Testudinibacter sp. TR-2022]
MIHPQYQESRYWRWLLIGISLLFLTLLLLVPLLAIFYQALAAGLPTFWLALRETEALNAIKLTLLVALISLPINVFFGLVMAWLLSNFDFKGKNLLTTLIDLPLSVSPVVAGLMLVLLFGINGLFGVWLDANDIEVIFALPGIVLATLFVTFPLVVKSLLPTLKSLGNSEEQAALTLGASFWAIFFRVTLPKIKWPLLYGAILANARAMGEFGAVSVVSGHIRNQTNTIPLHVEILYNEYQFTAAFACASLLALLAILTLLLQNVVAYLQRRKRRQHTRLSDYLPDTAIESAV